MSSWPLAADSSTSAIRSLKVPWSIDLACFDKNVFSLMSFNQKNDHIEAMVIPLILNVV